MTTENLPDVVDTNVDSGKVGVIEDKNDDLSGKQRKRAVRKAKPKSKREKEKKSLIPKV